MNELLQRMIKPTCTEYEPLPQIGLLLKKLSEVNDAFIKGDIDAAVGEICDLIAISVNTLALLNDTYDSKYFKPFELLYHVSYRGIIKHLISAVNSCICICNNENFNLEVEGYKSIIDVCLDCIYWLGYSPELALEETVKKTESGHKPDYSLAKLYQ